MEIATFLETLDQTEKKFEISKNPGIGIEYIRKFEKKLNIELPDDLVTLYTFSNGFEGDYLFNIISLDKLSRDKDDEGEYIEFSEYLIYSETCGLEINPLDKNRYRIFTWIWTHESGISKRIKRKYVADSIIDFIKLYLNNGVLGIWGDDEGQ